MNPEPTELFASLRALVAKVSPEELPELIGALEEVKAVASARLISVSAIGQPEALADDRFLTAQQAAELLCVPTGHIYELIRRGELPSLRVGKKYVRIPVSGLKAWMAQPEQKGLDMAMYTVYSPRKAQNPYDRQGTPANPKAARADAVGPGRAPRRYADHRGAVGAGRGADSGADGEAHPAPGEDGTQGEG